MELMRVNITIKSCIFSVLTQLLWKPLLIELRPNRVVQLPLLIVTRLLKMNRHRSNSSLILQLSCCLSFEW